jgi:presenilin-like A22 family membrane protease
LICVGLNNLAKPSCGQIIISATLYAAGCILISMALANGTTVGLISNRLCPRDRARAAQR